MKYVSGTRFFISLALVCVSTLAVGAAQGAWQSGRIVEVRRSVESKPLYWIANTPVTKDETTYTISVHLGQKLLVGIYTLDKSHRDPPAEWVRGRPVKIQLDRDDMYLKPLAGYDVKLRIAKRKSVAIVQAVTDAEMKQAYAQPAPPESLIGFGDSEEKSTAESKNSGDGLQKKSVSAAGQPAKKEAGPTGTIHVTTVPYLAEIYVDGVSIGYSPARFTLPTGKHVLRAQKEGYQTWSKDITVLESSEFTVYADLRKK